MATLLECHGRIGAVDPESHNELGLPSLQITIAAIEDLDRNVMVYTGKRVRVLIVYDDD